MEDYDRHGDGIVDWDLVWEWFRYLSIPPLADRLWHDLAWQEPNLFDAADMFVDAAESQLCRRTDSFDNETKSAIRSALQFGVLLGASVMSDAHRKLHESELPEDPLND